MTMKGPFLRFDKLEPPETRKTGVWRVASAVRSGDFLGIIEWSAPWRRYVFITKPAEMDFDYACLTEISRFISERMEERSHE